MASLQQRISRTQSDSRVMVPAEITVPHYRWENANISTSISTNAIVTGKFNEEQHYVARHNGMDAGNTDLSTFIGPYIKGKGLCRVPLDETNTEPLESFELLVVEGDVEWRKMVIGTKSGTKQLPIGSIPVATEKNESLFIGKRGGVGVGTVIYNEGEQKYEFFSHLVCQPYTEGFEILCFKEL